MKVHHSHVGHSSRKMYENMDSIMTFWSSKQSEANRGLGQCDAIAVGLSHLQGNMARNACGGLWLEEEHTVETLSWLEVGKWDVCTERIQVRNNRVAEIGKKMF